MGKPVLWHIPVSHYSEKVRWALAWKQLEHVRKAPPGGMHMAFALAMTRGRATTFPVMQWDGATWGDSTEIIAALEERVPEPPLYPTDQAERARALELEDWLDEEVGPPVRLVAWHELIGDPERVRQLTAKLVPPAMARFEGAATSAARSFVKLRYQVASPEAAERARGEIAAALDRLERELDGREYLVGDRFSVADLTAASLLYPVVDPPEGPHLLETLPPGLERFRAGLEDRPGFRWVAEMFRRHRG